MGKLSYESITKCKYNYNKNLSAFLRYAVAICSSVIPLHQALHHIISATLTGGITEIYEAQRGVQ